MLIVAGPKYDYTQPEVDAIKTYVENGGRALFLIDPPLKLGREDNAGSPALADCHRELGRDPEQGSGARHQRHRPDLRPGSRSSAGDELRIAADRPRPEGSRHGVSAGSHARSQVAGERHRREAVLDVRQQLCHHRLNSAEIRIDPKTDKKGPLTLGAAGTYNNGGDKSKEGRFVVVGSSNWMANNILRSTETATCSST